MKTRLGITLGLAGSLLASPVLAQEGAVSSQASSKGSIGVQLDLLPAGTLSIDGPNFEDSTDAAAAFAIGGTLDFDVTPFISIGAAPRLIFNVTNDGADDDADAAKQIDLRARVKVHGPVAPKVQAYGFFAPGYSVILSPVEEDDDPTGLVVAFGGGLTYDVSSKAYLSAELGYQLGFQSIEVQGTTVDVTTDYLHFGFGAGTRF
jgi:hypothetical protein